MILFLLFRKFFVRVLCLYIVFWYVIRILVFDMVGFIKVFLYLFNKLNVVLFNLNLFSILLIINICGLWGL